MTTNDKIKAVVTEFQKKYCGKNVDQNLFIRTVCAGSHCGTHLTKEGENWLQHRLEALVLEVEARRDEQWRQQLSGRILHETFIDVASKLYNRDWQGTPFEDLDDKSVRRYNAVAVEVASNIKDSITNNKN